MKIDRIEIVPVTIPFRKEIADSSGAATGTAVGRWTVCEFVLVMVRTDEGLTGYGEVPPWIRVGRESQAGIVAMLEKHIAPEILGQDPFDTHKIWTIMDAAAPGNTMAKTPIDLALYDLMGKALGVPAYRLAGGMVRDRIPLTGIVGLGPPAEVAKLVEMWLEAGYRTIRLKIGLGLEKDREIVQTARRIAGPEVRLRVDANQAYRPKEAVRVIRALESYDLELVEQPVAAGDFEGLAWLHSQIATPVMPHESLYDLEDARRLVEMRAVDLLGLKMDRPGGFGTARVAADLAELHNIPCTVISSVELGVSTSASMMFAATLKSLEYAGEASGSLVIADDVVREPLRIEGGTAFVPSGPGLGVELDLDKVRRYGGPPVVVS